MVIAWNTGTAAERARHNLKLNKKKKKNKKPQATSRKPQAYKNFFWPTIPTRRQASSSKRLTIEEL